MMSETERALFEAREDYARACQTIAQMHAAAVGEMTGPRRGVVEDVADLRAQIDRLAAFILAEIPGEPSQSEGAVDTAIRLLRRCVAKLERRGARCQ